MAAPLEPVQPHLDIAFFAQKPRAFAATCAGRQEVVEPGQDRLVGQSVRVEEIELRPHVVGKCARDEGCVGPRLPTNAGRADLGRRSSRNDRGADRDTFVGCPGNPNRRHSVAVASRVGQNLDVDALGVLGRLEIVIPDGLVGHRGARIGVGNRNRFAVVVGLAFPPLAHEVVALGWVLFAAADPVRNHLVVDEHVREDDLGPLLTKAFHQVGIALPVDVFDNAEDAFFRVDGAHRAVFGYPHLREVVTDETVPRHRRRSFAAAARGRSAEEGRAAARTVEAGNEHVFRELFAGMEIGGEVDRKAVVPLLHEKGVPGVCAVHRVGGEP